MGVAKDLLQLDVGYSAWAGRRLLEACSALTIADRCRDLGQSHRSVLGTLRHIYEGERFWSDCLQANEMPPLEEIGDSGVPREPRLEELEEEWHRVWTSLEEWLAAVPEEGLGEILRCERAAGADLQFTRWQLLRHSVNHSTLHRGQVVGMLRALGRQPPNVDLISFYALK